MIKYEARYFNNAHRISDVPIDPSVATLYDGQWMQVSATGTAVISDGAVNKKSYMTISSKYGNLGINLNQDIASKAPETTILGSQSYPVGRDTVSPTGTVALLMGPFRVETDQFVATETYNQGAALKVYDGASDAAKNGKLVPFVVGTDDALKIVAYVFKAPVSAGDFMVIAHE